jgi:hypothetical protein
MIRGTNSFHERLHTRRGIAGDDPEDGSVPTKTLFRTLLRREPDEYSRGSRPRIGGGTLSVLLAAGIDEDP